MECTTLATKKDYLQPRYSWDWIAVQSGDIDHATSTSICNASSRRAAAAGRIDTESKLNIARYHMIELQINLMNFSAVTTFFARVVFHFVSVLVQVSDFWATRGIWAAGWSQWGTRDSFSPPPPQPLSLSLSLCSSPILLTWLASCTFLVFLWERKVNKKSINSHDHTLCAKERPQHKQAGQHKTFPFTKEKTPGHTSSEHSPVVTVFFFLSWDLNLKGDHLLGHCYYFLCFSLPARVAFSENTKKKEHEID